jgi:hypothetical protein
MIIIIYCLYKLNLFSGNAAKKEWKKLRDRLREAVKRQKRITGQ